jgi:hypothetical protein
VKLTQTAADNYKGMLPSHALSSFQLLLDGTWRDRFSATDRLGAVA